MHMIANNVNFSGCLIIILANKVEFATTIIFSIGAKLLIFAKYYSPH